jgi:hypothetical protein
MLAALGWPASLPAQETKVATPAGSTPLGRYFPKEDLIVYLEFSGLDAHADAWSKTAAHKMLTDTTLGEVFEEVGTQLLDKALSYVPGHKLGGKEIVTLLEHAAHHGFAMGIYLKATSSDKIGDFLKVTMVLRDGASKPIRALSSRLMGTFWSEGRPRLEQKQGRTVVVIPTPEAAAATVVKSQGDSWWAEKDDLVVCSTYPSGADLIFGALDGKVPSVLDHPVMQDLAKKEGTFEPVCIGFLDVAACPKNGKATEPFQKMVDVAGIQRLAFRWGFDDEGLTQEVRIVAPKPRKPYLALFDQPGFDAKSLMPLPQAIDSFVQLAVDPNALIDSIAQLAPEGTVKAKVDEFAESIRTSGKIDFRKDFLGRIGPRMVLYMAPDKSAAVNAGSFQTEWLQGLTAQAGVPTSWLSSKLTLVAEITEPKTFGRTLEGAINALNHELTRETSDRLRDAEKDEAKTGDGPGAAAGAPPAGGRVGRGGGRGGSTRKRASATNLAPRFVPMVGGTSNVDVGSGASPDRLAFILKTPSESPLKLGPANFYPVIKLDGSFLAISVSSDAADEALKAAKQKRWQPSEDLQKAAEHLPAKVVVLAVSDSREIMPDVLASLPGRLQILINSALAMSRMQIANQQQAGANPNANPQAGGPGGQMMMGRGRGRGSMPSQPGGSEMMRGRGRGGMAPGGPGGPGAAGAPGFGGGGSGANNPGESPADAKVELKVDAELPKAEELRTHYFLTTYAITVTEQDVRVISRQAFLTHYDLMSFALFVYALPPAYQAAREARQKAIEANQQAAGAQSPPGGPGAGGGPGQNQPGPGGRGMPGGGRGMRPGGGRGRGGPGG